MPQEPKRRHSKARKRTRRASIFLSSLGTVVCKKCGSKTLPHLVCINCGFYKNRQVGDLKSSVKVTKV